ncbi:hypothetical protein [Acidocella sp.]|uniref:hypothetical protein n=1 Tax=Acidocella sp. TaxID=50710 RepID=UPI002629031F|nr:hypothetical protein [Acidocella sp.]
MGGGDAFNGLILNTAATLMGLVNFIDDFLINIMLVFGIIDPQWQLCFMLFLISLMVMMVMRTLGGLFGWVALLFAILLLLRFILPTVATQI